MVAKRMSMDTKQEKVVVKIVDKPDAASDTQDKLPTIKKLMEAMKKGLKFVWKDMTKQHLIWVKIIFFLQSASLVTLYPYMTIHLKALGFTIEDASIVNSVIPGADIFGPPLAGFLADKLGNFRLFMAALTLLNGASSLLLLAVPSVISNNGTEEAQEGIIHAELNVTRHWFEHNNWNAQEFWWYLLARVLLDVLRASSLMLFEGAVVSIIKQHGGDYGLQKLFGTLGAVIFGPLSGVLIDFGQGADAYTGVIVLYCVIRALTAVCILRLDLDFKPKGKKVLTNLGITMWQVEMMGFLLAFSVAGVLWGYLENFLFWHLEDLGATKFLMGISLAIGTLAGVPLTVFSSMIIQSLGHKNIVTIALLLYAVRMFGFAELVSVEPFLALEVVKPFCQTLLLISVMTFVKDKSPMTTMASVEAIFGSAYFGVGRGLGGLFGGFSIDAVGNVWSFRIFGGVAASSAGLYYATMSLLTWRKKKKYVVNYV